jgi:Protein of unknown function (DUF1553)/Protein of unknown function (DUF1549)/Planctomycete cytochrome C
MISRNDKWPSASLAGPLGALLCAAAAMCGSLHATSAAEPNYEFFEQRIRPVLVEHCGECHSAQAKTLRGGLRVDSRQALRRGGDSGPALVPGKPDESLLLAALRYEGPKMPPQGKLPAEVISDFVKWIESGAPDPRDSEAPVAARAVDVEAGRRFWSFQPPVRRPLPEPAESAWARTPIDRFILAALERQGLRPAADADRWALVRRAYFDLIGLPPTPEEIDAFVEDKSPGAFAHLVERLLESPRFGERWGRHWLDVARFAETTGGGRSMFFGSAWRYRDYVIRSFNEDKPYDRFVVEQLAGDLLPCDDYRQGQDQLVATAFLALGPTNYEEQDKSQLRMDVIDEQIDTTGRAFLGLTLGCARCHDHKFDPIPTTDYYALAGIFGSTLSLVNDNVSAWITRPLPVEPAAREALAAHAQKIAAVQARLDERQAELRRLRPGAASVTLVADAAELPGIVVDDTAAQRVGEWTESKSVRAFVGKGYVHDGGTGKGNKSIAFRADLPRSGKYDVRMSYSPSKNRATRVPVKVTYDGGESIVFVNQRQAPSHDGLFTPLGAFRFANDQTAIVTVTNDKTSDGVVVADAVQFVPSEGQAAQGPTTPSAHRGDSETAVGGAAHDPTATNEMVHLLETELTRLKKDLAALKKSAPPAPPVVMSVRDEAKVADCAVCIRGELKNPGAVVPRGFVTVATMGPMPKLPADSSGRLELARWIASGENPLAARVMVNRIWHHLFGAGIVRTVDNFGVAGERPSHPELLDYLALRFVEQHWSIKAMIREIMLSRTYQLGSRRSTECRSADPSNRLLAGQNRRRLDAEEIYDSMLALGGALNLNGGGDTIRPGTKAEYGYTFDVGRRAVYLPVLRNRLHEMLAVFDFPDPNLSIGDRTVSTLATQALFMMNSPLVMDQARNAAQLLLDAKQAGGEPLDDEARLENLYRRALGRLPSHAERQAAMQFLAVAGSPDDEAARLVRWSTLCQALIGCIDFRYID